MDDLDRLYYEFVEIMRRERLSALTEPLRVLDLHDKLIPYRKVRDAAGLRSNDDYEVALMRLLSGERGYLDGDQAMQEELCAALDETLPDIRRYRAFPDTKVTLNPALIPPPGHIRYAPPEIRERAEQVETPIEETEEPLSPSEVNEIELPEPEPVDEGPLEPEPGAEEPLEPGPCPMCSADVPTEATFCPFCGARVIPGVCVGCGAELDPTWLYCAECGRPRDDRAADSP